jgi:hypothetical protein
MKRERHTAWPIALELAALLSAASTAGAARVTGTIVMNYGPTYRGRPLRCSSGQITWTATLRS